MNFFEAPAYFFTISFIGLTNGAVYALVALGYTLVYGILELINFAHGDVFMLGGMISATMVISVFGLHAHESGGVLVLAIVCSLLVAMAACGLINATIERDRLPAVTGGAATCALDHGDRDVIHPPGRRDRLEGLSYVAVPPVLPTSEVFSIAGRGRTPGRSSSSCSSPAGPARLIWLVQRTKQGKAMRATAQDRDAAAMMGINVNRTISFTFLIAGALAGAGGLLYALYFGQVRYDTGFQLGLIAFTAAVLGGIGNLPGAVLGALCIGFIQAFNDGLQWHSPGSDWTQSIVFAILILILVFRPEGLLGERTPEGA